MNWFVITGWAIVLFLGNAILQTAGQLHKKPREKITSEAFGIVVYMLIGVWIVVAIGRGA